jgi:hypothetical protein
MPIKIKSTSGGSVTIDVPSTAVDTTMMLPVTNAGLVSNTNPVMTGNVAISGANSYLSINGSNVSPFGGMRNRIINGDMRIDQRNAGAAVTLSSTSDTYPLDRFLCEQGAVTSNSGTVQRVSDAPSDSGLTFSLKYTAGSISFNNSTGWSALSQRIEGFNVADLAWGSSAAKSVTLSFWVKSSLTGLYTINLTHYDGSTERWNNITYNINSANTWEFKTLTFPGDTAFRITNDNGVTGWMRVYWAIGDNSGGASTTTSFNTWFTSSSTKRAASGQTNVISTNGATFQITGVQLEAGTVATPFEFRHYGQELALCQRYYFQYGGEQIYDTPSMITGWGTTAAYSGGSLFYPVPMRVIPTLSISSASHWYFNAVDYIPTCTSVLLYSATTKNTGFALGFASGGAVNGRSGFLQANATISARLYFSAEL